MPDLYHCPRMNARMTERTCETNRKWVTWKPSIKPGASKRSRKLIKGRSAQMGTLERLDVQADRAIYCRGCPGVRAIAEQKLDVMDGWAVDKPTEWPEDPRRFCPRGKHLRIAWWSVTDGWCRACRAELQSAKVRASDRCRQGLHPWPESRSKSGECSECRRTRDREKRRAPKRSHPLGGAPTEFGSLSVGQQGG